MIHTRLPKRREQIKVLRRVFWVWKCKTHAKMQQQINLITEQGALEKSLVARTTQRNLRKSRSLREDGMGKTRNMCTGRRAIQIPHKLLHKHDLWTLLNSNRLHYLAPLLDNCRSSKALLPSMGTTVSLILCSSGATNFASVCEICCGFKQIRPSLNRTISPMACRYFRAAFKTDSFAHLCVKLENY